MYTAAEEGSSCTVGAGYPSVVLIRTHVCPFLILKRTHQGERRRALECARRASIGSGVTYDCRRPGKTGTPRMSRPDGRHRLRRISVLLTIAFQAGANYRPGRLARPGCLGLTAVISYAASYTCTPRTLQGPSPLSLMCPFQNQKRTHLCPYQHHRGVAYSHGTRRSLLGSRVHRSFRIEHDHFMERRRFCVRFCFQAMLETT